MYGGEIHVSRLHPEPAEMTERQSVATAKVRVWGSRADQARRDGRKADADRCDDKVRDWASKARQIERIQSSENQRPQGAAWTIYWGSGPARRAKGRR